MGRALPAVGDLGKLGACVIPLHLFLKDRENTNTEYIVCTLKGEGKKESLRFSFIMFA